MVYVQLDGENRIVAYADFEQDPGDVWVESPWDEIPDDFADWLLVDGQLVHDPRDLPPTPYGAEQVLAAMMQETDALEALPDSALAHMAPYMAKWASGMAYAVGDKVQYGERPYRCLQPHESQDAWTPEDAPSLWARILVPSPDVIPDWEQPSSTNPYMRGDKVRHVGKVWESLVDNNVWEPGAPGTESLWSER